MWLIHHSQRLAELANMFKKKFRVEVMFITSSKVICRVVDGFKKEKSEVEGRI